MKATSVLDAIRVTGPPLYATVTLLAGFFFFRGCKENYHKHLWTTEVQYGIIVPQGSISYAENHYLNVSSSRGSYLFMIGEKGAVLANVHASRSRFFLDYNEAIDASINLLSDRTNSVESLDAILLSSTFKTHDLLIEELNSKGINIAYEKVLTSSRFKNMRIAFNPQRKVLEYDGNFIKID